MDPILGALWVMGVIYASGKAWSHATAARKKSRGGKGRFQHNAAWWTRETAHGFPSHRAGFASGWLAHKTALDHRRAQREEARTTHLETRASILSGVREHRRRQAEAQALIDQAGQPFLDEVAQRRKAAKQKMRDADEALQENSEAEKKAGIREETPQFHELNNAYWEAREEYKNAKRRAPRAGPQNEPLSTEGATPVATTADVNYTQTLEQTDRLKDEVEQAINEINWEEMGNTLDQLGSMLAGDRDSMAAAAEVADELRQAKKQLEQTHDAVTELRNTLVRNHGGIKEAVDDSPVEQPAEPEFYTD